MTDVLLVILIVIFGITSLVSGLCYLENSEDWVAGLSITTGIVSILLIAWLISAVVQDSTIKRTLLVNPISTTKEDGSIIQMIVFTDLDGNQVMRNVQDLIHSYVPAGSKIQVTEYNREGYNGVTFISEVYSLKPTYKVVKEELK